MAAEVIRLEAAGLTLRRRAGDVEILRSFQRRPAIVSRSNPYVLALRDAVSRSVEGEALSIGRDGASDAISFLEAGIPAGVVNLVTGGGEDVGPRIDVFGESLGLLGRQLHVMGELAFQKGNSFSGKSMGDNHRR